MSTSVSNFINDEKAHAKAIFENNVKGATPEQKQALAAAKEARAAATGEKAFNVGNVVISKQGDLVLNVSRYDIADATALSKGEKPVYLKDGKNSLGEYKAGSERTPSAMATFLAGNMNAVSSMVEGKSGLEGISVKEGNSRGNAYFKPDVLVENGEKASDKAAYLDGLKAAVAASRGETARALVGRTQSRQKKSEGMER